MDNLLRSKEMFFKFTVQINDLIKTKKKYDNAVKKVIFYSPCQNILEDPYQVET
jgi:hypothetical protein